MACPVDKTMPIFVRLVDGKSVVVEVEDTDLVGSVKSQLRLSTGILVEDQRLLFGRKELIDECRLADYGAAPSWYDCRTIGGAIHSRERDAFLFHVVWVEYELKEDHSFYPSATVASFRNGEYKWWTPSSWCSTFFKEHNIPRPSLNPFGCGVVRAGGKMLWHIRLEKNSSLVLDRWSMRFSMQPLPDSYIPLGETADGRFCAGKIEFDHLMMATCEMADDHESLLAPANAWVYEDTTMTTISDHVPPLLLLTGIGPASTGHVFISALLHGRWVYNRRTHEVAPLVTDDGVPWGREVFPYFH